MSQLGINDEAEERYEKAKESLPKLDNEAVARGSVGLIKRAYEAGEPTRARRPKWMIIIVNNIGAFFYLGD